VLWKLICYVRWYSSTSDDIQLQQMIFNGYERYSSRATYFLLSKTIFRIISSTVDETQPLRMIIIYRVDNQLVLRMIFDLRHMIFSKNSSRSQLSAPDDNRDILGETTQGWHHGSENPNQFFYTDSPIKLK
jgi:hypothetical protein